MSVILHCLGICKLVQKPVHGFSVRKHTFRNSQKHIVFLQQAFQNQNPGVSARYCIPGTRNPAFVIFTTQVSFFHLVCPGFQESQSAALPIQKNTRNSQYSANSPLVIWNSNPVSTFSPSISFPSFYVMPLVFS